MYLNRWKPGQPLEFNEPLSVPSARESSVGMETNCYLESALSCVLSLRALAEVALAQIHNWVHQSHIAWATWHQHKSSYCCTSAPQDRAVTWCEALEAFPWCKEHGGWTLRMTQTELTVNSLTPPDLSWISLPSLINTGSQRLHSSLSTSRLHQEMIRPGTSGYGSKFSVSVQRRQALGVWTCIQEAQHAKWSSYCGKGFKHFHLW